MAIDGELAGPRNGEVNRHLSHCWECRGRRAQFERAITDYMAFHRDLAEEARLSPGGGPTARLRATLANQQTAEPSRLRTWRQWATALAPRNVITGSAAALLLPLGFFVWLSVRSLEASGPLPDARLTPGATRFISRQQVCRLAPEDEGRLVPADLAQRVFEQYRIANPKPRAYEVDYLISPALGGTTAIQNLWPVPYADGVWTSRVKDALEDRLRNMVCEGQLDLATAQHEIATNWIAAYQKYFRTKTPVAAHALFVKDSPWEK